MTEANVETLRRGYEALNAGDLSRVMELIDDRIEWNPGELAPDSPGPSSGRDAFEQFIRSWIDAFEHFRVEPVEVVEDGPFLVATVRQSGRGRASGVEIEIEIAHVWTTRDGRAVRLQSYRSTAEALEAVRAASRS